MGGLPSLRATGQKVWSRFRDARAPFDHLRDNKFQALRLEVERVTAARSAQERATQLARVLDAVSALAEAHGLSDAELSALRTGRARTSSVAALKRQIKLRASGVVAQVWSASPVSPVNVAFRVGTLSAAVPTAFAAGVLKRKLLGAKTKKKPARTRVVLRVGRSGQGRARMQLVAASMLHLPRLQRQLVALRRGADRAMQGVRLPALPSTATEHIATAGLILRSSRSGMRLTYEVASAGAQLFLRSYLFPRMLRYLSAGLTTGVALREVATARVLPPAR
jgi:hypothetical protein